MPLPNVANCIKFSLNGTWTGQPWANIFHVLYTGGPPTAADMASLCNGMATNYHDQFMQQMPASVTLDHTKGTDLTSLTSAQADPATPRVGSHAAAFTVPNSVALGVEWAIATRYRGGHPKTFFPGIPNGSLTDPITWDSTFLATFQTLVNTFLLGIPFINSGTTVLDQMCCVHYVKGKVNLAVPTIDRITAGGVKSMIYSQRGRRT